MELLTRAYSMMEVKSVDAKARTFSGVATTPATDRIGDTINPMGATFAKSIVLLHQHKHDEPIGSVTFDKPTKNGINFKAAIPTVDREGLFKQRVDLAWDEIDYGVVRAVSIGFKPIKYAFTDDGVDYQEIEIYELSTVSIPALPAAVIAQIKSMQGAPLPRDVVRSIQLADRRGAGIPLVRASSGGIKLLR